MKKLCAVILAPLSLSGCMMLGMGGMGLSGGGGKHGASQSSTTRGQTIIKDSIVSGIRITTEYPPYVLGDALAYTVTLRDVRDKSMISDATIALIVTPDDNRSKGSRSGHLDSSVMQNQRSSWTMKMSPEVIGNGTYVFRPSITTGGAYRFTFVVEKVDNVTISPAIEVEQTFQLLSQTDQQSENGGHKTGSGISPAVLIGAGAMAIMMLFMFR